MDDKWFKERRIHTMADAQRFENAWAKQRGIRPKELKQLGDGVRGVGSPLGGFSQGNGDYSSMWRVPPKR